MVKIVTVSSEEAGQRVDNFIFKHLKGVPKVRVYRAIRQGEVRVNKGRVQASYRIKDSDQIRVPPLSTDRNPVKIIKPRPEVDQALQQRIVYEDKGLIVINKPAGLSVHGGSGIQGGVIELFHRLDRETSGCLLLAKKRSVLLAWHRHLLQRQARKQYITLVKGNWQEGSRRVEAPLIKNILQSGERMVKVSPEGKAAVTLFRPIKIFKDMSLIEASPLTGRTHQIRVHLQHIGYPIAADSKYGDKDFNQTVKNLGLKRLFLHAASISCPGDPVSDEGAFGLCIPLDQDLAEFIKKLQ